MHTSWDLQQLIRSGATSYGPDPGAPYADSLTPSYLESFEKATRPSTRKDHELQHCQLLPRHESGSHNRVLLPGFQASRLSTAVSHIRAGVIRSYLFNTKGMSADFRGGVTCLIDTQLSARMRGYGMRPRRQRRSCAEGLMGTPDAPTGPAARAPVLSASSAHPLSTRDCGPSCSDGRSLHAP